MAKHERQIHTRPSHLVSYLDREIHNSGMSVELVDFAVQRVGGVTVWLYVYDKYYMRNTSRASLTLQIIGGEDSAYVAAIGAGGGNGNVLNFDFGAGSDFVGIVEELLDKYVPELG